MHNDWIIANLEKNKAVFHSLLVSADAGLRKWRPAENKWNLHEIVCHLLDEEQFDFKARIKHTIAFPGLPMQVINPEAWVQEKLYANWDYEGTLEIFFKEREKSILYLKTVNNKDWQSTHLHPQLGLMSAEKFLYNWLAHDYLHIRQINRYQYLFLKENTSIDLNYAGTW